MVKRGEPMAQRGRVACRRPRVLLRTGELGVPGAATERGTFRSLVQGGRHLEFVKRAPCVQCSKGRMNSFVVAAGKAR